MSKTNLAKRVIPCSLLCHVDEGVENTLKSLKSEEERLKNQQKSTTRRGVIGILLNPIEATDLRVILLISFSVLNIRRRCARYLRA